MKKHYDYDIQLQKENNLFLVSLLNKLIRFENLYHFISKSNFRLETMNKTEFNKLNSIVNIVKSICNIFSDQDDAINLYRRLSFVNNLDYSDGIFYLDTLFGSYEFSKIITRETCPKETYEYYYQNKKINQCHGFSLVNMSLDPTDIGIINHLEGKELLTFFWDSILKNHYHLHSAILHDGVIYDVFNNFKMEAEAYKQLVGYEHVSTLTWEEIAEDLFENEIISRSCLKSYLSNPDIYRKKQEAIRKKTI